MNAEFARYLSDGFDLIEGWLSPTTAHIMATLADEQTRRGIAGDIAEIGVHHGKSFLALANSIAPGERLFAIDVFEDQHKNVDNSGSGSREMFLANLTTYAPGRTVDIVPESSLDLPAQGWPKAHAGSIRFFSIDGSHTREATLNDLRIAEQTATPGGLIVLDDVLSSHWLGVISGLFDYLSGGGTLLPTVMIPNKLLLASDAVSKSEWMAFLQEHYGRSLSKSGVDLLGYSVDVFEEDAALCKPKVAVIDQQPQLNALTAPAEELNAARTAGCPTFLQGETDRGDCGLPNLGRQRTMTIAPFEIVPSPDLRYVIYLPTENRDDYQTTVAHNGAFDHTIQLLLSLAKPGQVAVDLGANVGTETIPLALKGVRVIAYEALQENVTSLTASVVANKLENLVIVRHAAATNETKIVRVDAGSAWGVIRERGEPVAGLSLDEDLARYTERIDLVKLDIEGQEYNALQGMQATLSRQMPHIVYETNALANTESGACIETTHEFLRQLGYTVYRISRDRLSAIRAGYPQECITADNLATIASPEALANLTGIAVTEWTVSDIEASVRHQNDYFDEHKAYVAAVSDFLPIREFNTCTREMIARWYDRYATTYGRFAAIRVASIGAAVMPREPNRILSGSYVASKLQSTRQGGNALLTDSLSTGELPTKAGMVVQSTPHPVPAEVCLAQELDAVYHSTSWRVTAPLRTAKKLFRIACRRTPIRERLEN